MLIKAQTNQILTQITFEPGSDLTKGYCEAEFLANVFKRNQAAGASCFVKSTIRIITLNVEKKAEDVGNITAPEIK